MSELITPSNITFVLGLIAIIFSIFNYFRTPQIEQDKEGSLLAQSVDIEKAATAERFKELGTRLDTSLSLAQNHIHTVDTKVDGVIGSLNAMNVQITKLATIIEERIPRN